MSDNGTYIHIASVGGTYSDFSKLDLSPWGIQGGLIEDQKTEKHIKLISIKEKKERNWQHIKKISQGVEGGVGMHGDWKYMNLLWPIDLDNPPDQLHYWKAIEAIRIAHPSELYVQTIFDVQYFKGKGVYFSGWATYNSYIWSKYKKPTLHYFQYPEDYLDETNRFLAFYKENCEKHDYIRNAIRYYSDSFRVNSQEMAFLCLCICLETIVPGKEQLSFTFRRNLAVLCAESLEKGRKIFKNAKQLYSLRSKLVHSGMSSKDFAKFSLMFEYAQILASRMIIEMLLHNLPKIDELDQRITELGFGQGKNISVDYKEFKGNLFVWHKVSEYNFEEQS